MAENTQTVKNIATVSTIIKVVPTLKDTTPEAVCKL